MIRLFLALSKCFLSSNEHFPEYTKEKMSFIFSTVPYLGYLYPVEILLKVVFCEVKLCL